MSSWCVKLSWMSKCILKYGHAIRNSAEASCSVTEIYVVTRELSISVWTMYIHAWNTFGACKLESWQEPPIVRFQNKNMIILFHKIITYRNLRAKYIILNSVKYMEIIKRFFNFINISIYTFKKVDESQLIIV
jgi:hypothetical protein